MQPHATKLAPGSVLHAMACDQACQGASCMHRHVTKPARERPACGGHVAKLAAGVGPRLWRQCVYAQRSWPCSPGPEPDGEVARVRRNAALHHAGRPVHVRHPPRQHRATAAARVARPAASRIQGIGAELFLS